MLTLEQGKRLIAIARKSIGARVSGKTIRVRSRDQKDLFVHSGVYVSIKKEGKLRGYTGFTEPKYPLYEAVNRAASGAAGRDPRFKSLTKEELALVTIEISILGKASAIHVRNANEYLGLIRLGKDGVIVKGTYHKGMLLPHVATEFGWDVATYLDQICIQGGLNAGDWKDYNECRIYKFPTQIFAEESPGGNIVQVS